MKNALPMRVKFAKLFDEAVIPTYAHKGDSGMDLVTPVELILKPGVPTFVDTGIAVEIPKGFEGQVRSRSGMTRREGITACGGLGTIDSTYRGTIGVTLTWGLSMTEMLNCIMYQETLKNAIQQLFSMQKVIHAGSKIAQFVVAPVVDVEQVVVDFVELTQTVRGANGYGSTGT